MPISKHPPEWFRDNAKTYEHNSAIYYASPASSPGDRRRSDNQAERYQKRADRFLKAADYLEKRYGSGHDMAHHGEGKPHGDAK